MKTTKEYKDRYLSSPLEIEDDLIKIFGPHGSPTIYDIGACDCLTSIKYAKIFLNSPIYAFEPRQDNCNEAIENVSEYELKDRIFIHRMALGNVIQDNVHFFASYGQAPNVGDSDTGNKSSSLLEPADHLNEHKWCKFTNELVNVRTLDCLLEDPFYFAKPDFIHIDVQGAEKMVFECGSECLEYCSAVWCEVATIELYKGQPLRLDIVKMMYGYGFEVWKDTSECKKYGDILFVKRGLKCQN